MQAVHSEPLGKSRRGALFSDEESFESGRLRIFAVSVRTAKERLVGGR
jgi:hypothetical protein